MTKHSNTSQCVPLYWSLVGGGCESLQVAAPRHGAGHRPAPARHSCAQWPGLNTLTVGCRLPALAVSTTAHTPAQPHTRQCLCPVTSSSQQRDGQLHRHVLRDQPRGSQQQQGAAAPGRGLLPRPLPLRPARGDPGHQAGGRRPACRACGGAGERGR